MESLRLELARLFAPAGSDKAWRHRITERLSKLNRLGGFLPAHQAIAICEAAGIGVSVDTNPYTIIGDTAVCHIAAVVRTAYPVDCEGHVSFLDMGAPTITVPASITTEAPVNGGTWVVFPPPSGPSRVRNRPRLGMVDVGADSGAGIGPS